MKFHKYNLSTIERQFDRAHRIITAKADILAPIFGFTPDDWHQVPDVIEAHYLHLFGTPVKTEREFIERFHECRVAPTLTSIEAIFYFLGSQHDSNHALYTMMGRWTAFDGHFKQNKHETQLTTALWEHCQEALGPVDLSVLPRRIHAWYTNDGERIEREHPLTIQDALEIESEIEAGEVDEDAIDELMYPGSTRFIRKTIKSLKLHTTDNVRDVGQIKLNGITRPCVFATDEGKQALEKELAPKRIKFIRAPTPNGRPYNLI